MENTRSNRTKPVSRLLGLSLLLFAAIWGTCECWLWNLREQADDPAILIHSGGEAVRGARKFFVLRKAEAADYDLTKVGSLTQSRCKGQPAWIIDWVVKPSVGHTNKLVVLVTERGWLFTADDSSQGYDLRSVARE